MVLQIQGELLAALRELAEVVRDVTKSERGEYVFIPACEDKDKLVLAAFALMKADRAIAKAAGDLMNEDELPEDITDAEYSAWFARSFIPGGIGCRVGPRFAR